MRRTTTMTIRLSGALSDFVAANVGETGMEAARRESANDDAEHRAMPRGTVGW